MSRIIVSSVKPQAVTILDEAVECHKAARFRGALHAAYDAINYVCERGYLMPALKRDESESNVYPWRIGKLVELEPAIKPLVGMMLALGRRRNNMAHNHYVSPRDSETVVFVDTTILLFDVLAIQIPKESLDFLSECSLATPTGVTPAKFEHRTIGRCTLQSGTAPRLGLSFLKPDKWESRAGDNEMTFESPWAFVTFRKDSADGVEDAGERIDQMSRTFTEITDGPTRFDSEVWSGAWLEYEALRRERVEKGLWVVGDPIGKHLISVNLGGSAAGYKLFRPLFLQIADSLRITAGSS